MTPIGLIVVDLQNEYLPGGTRDSGRSKQGDARVPRPS